MSPELKVISSQDRTPGQEPAEHCLDADLQLGSVLLSRLIKNGHRVAMPGFEAHDDTITHETHCNECDAGVAVITRYAEDNEELVIGVRELQHGKKLEECPEQG